MGSKDLTTELKEACDEFERKEGRAIFYDLAAEIADKYPLQASLIILLTWNKRRSGKFISFSNNDNIRKNVKELEDVLEYCKPLFERIKEKEFRTVNFDELGDTVKEVYKRLSDIEGVEYTGASKIMHLLKRDLFVMWDSSIRKHYNCSKDDEGYLEFQKLMQEKFKDVEWNDSKKTLPKAIDEYNYVNITLKNKKTKRKEK